MTPPDFGRSVNSISTRGTDYALLTTTGTPKPSDGPVLELMINRVYFERGMFRLTQAPPGGFYVTLQLYA